MSKGHEMAQRVHVLLVCDLHEQETEGTETVSFALDGAAYEIDVCNEHAKALRDAFAPYVGAGRRAGGRANGRRRARAGGGGGQGRAAEIRAWAREKGITVNERGRIPADVAAKFDAAHS
jgi:hypothetical protein